MEPGQHANPLEEALSHGSRRVAEVASLTGATAQVVLQRRHCITRGKPPATTSAPPRSWTNRNASSPTKPGSAGRPRTTRSGWPGPAWPGPAARGPARPAAPAPIPPPHPPCANARTGSASCTRTPWHGMTVSGPTARPRSTRCTRRRPSSAPPPGTRVGDPTPARHALAAAIAGTTQDAGPAADLAAGSTPEPGPGPDSDQQAGRRGRQIIDRLQSGARAAGRPEPGAGELAMVLEAATSLPGEMIDRLTRQAAAEGRARGEEQKAADAERARAAGLDGAIDLAAAASAGERTTGLTGAQHDAGTAGTARAHAGAGRSAARLAALSFPHSAADATRAAAQAGTRRPAQAPARIPAPEIAQRPGQPR